jgi:hypothetical protein
MKISFVIFQQICTYFISHRESLGVIGVIYRDSENGGGGNGGGKRGGDGCGKWKE